LKRVSDPIENLNFAFRTTPEFLDQQILTSKSLGDFIREHLGFNNPMYLFLIGLANSPYIKEEDFVKADYDYKELVFEGQSYSQTGLVAAFLKNSIAISLNNDTKWDNCFINLKIEGINSNSNTFKIEENVRNTSKVDNAIDCHLIYITNKFSHSNLKPKFDFSGNILIDLLPLISICSLYLHTDKNEKLIWKEFYEEISKLNTNERIDRIKNIAVKIATVHKWIPATGSLQKNNSSRIIYIIPNSNLLIGLDTQHGEFEIHSNKSGNNHLGAVSFDGKRIKPPIANRSLKI